MGGHQSTEEKKDVDTNGNVNKNVIIEAVETSSTLLTIIGVEMGILCIVAVIQLIIILYIYIYIKTGKELN